MKSILKLLTALMLIIALTFNIVSCDLFDAVKDGFGSNQGENNTGEENNGGNSDGGNTDGGSSGGGTEDGGNTGNGGTGGENTGNGGSGGEDVEDDYVFGEEYPTISMAEALAIAYDYTSAASTEKYYLIATVEIISNLKNGEMTLTDGVDSIYVYRSTDLNGVSLSSSDLAVGDILIICGTLRNYKGTLEIEKGQVIDYYTPGVDTPTRPGSGDSTDNDDDTNDDTDIDIPGDNIDGVGVDEQARNEFYGNSDPADSYEEAIERSKKGEISGADRVPDAEPYTAKNQPMSNGKYIRNSNSYYADENTYIVVNSAGLEVFRVYRGGGYITLDEVAAYVYAFGNVPANYVADKDTSPKSSIWGEYLRLNHNSFSGSTTKYPYEPELPNISGCGGYMKYMEIDIGTTGTDTGNGYEVRIYNNGSSIVRGAARIVYTHDDYDGDGVVENDEKYVFYTYNHYNDFQEYLNYYGGWGEIFGNVTGGGTLSSKYNYNPTPYVPVVLAPLPTVQTAYVIYYYISKDSLLAA